MSVGNWSGCSSSQSLPRQYSSRHPEIRTDEVNSAKLSMFRASPPPSATISGRWLKGFIDSDHAGA